MVVGVVGDVVVGGGGVIVVVGGGGGRGDNNLSIISKHTRARNTTSPRTTWLNFFAILLSYFQPAAPLEGSKRRRCRRGRDQRRNRQRARGPLCPRPPAPACPRGHAGPRGKTREGRHPALLGGGGGVGDLEFRRRRDLCPPDVPRGEARPEASAALLAFASAAAAVAAAYPPPRAAAAAARAWSDLLTAPGSPGARPPMLGAARGTSARGFLAPAVGLRPLRASSRRSHCCCRFWMLCSVPISGAVRSNVRPGTRQRSFFRTWGIACQRD